MSKSMTAWFQSHDRRADLPVQGKLALTSAVAPFQAQYGVSELLAEIAVLVGVGCRDQEISDYFTASGRDISVYAVRASVARLRHKTGLLTRVALAWAVRNILDDLKGQGDN